MFGLSLSASSAGSQDDQHDISLRRPRKIARTPSVFSRIRQIVQDLMHAAGQGEDEKPAFEMTAFTLVPPPPPPPATLPSPLQIDYLTSDPEDLRLPRPMTPVVAFRVPASASASAPNHRQGPYHPKHLEAGWSPRVPEPLTFVRLNQQADHVAHCDFCQREFRFYTSCRVS